MNSELLLYCCCLPVAMKFETWFVDPVVDIGFGAGDPMPEADLLRRDGMAWVPGIFAPAATHNKTAKNERKPA